MASSSDSTPVTSERPDDRARSDTPVGTRHESTGSTHGSDNGASSTLRLQLPVAGMTCQGCAHTVQRALAGVDGVTRAEVSFGSRTADVDVDTSRLPREQIGPRLSRALGPLGYRIPDDVSRDADLSRDVAFARDAEASESRHVRRALVLAAMFGSSTLLAGHFGAPVGVQVALAGVVVFVACNRVLATGARALVRLAPEMNTLVGLGLVAAWTSAAVAVVAPSALPDGERHLHDAVLIAFFVLLGRELESRARTRAGDAVRALLDLAPPTARVLRRGVEQEVPLSEVRRGNLVLVRPGERIPVDGLVLDGRTSVDESLLTGESLERDRAPGDKVHGGTLNGNGAITVQATGIGADSALGRIAQAVRTAQGSKARIQRVADRVSAVFVPIVLVVAVATWIAWSVSGAGASVALSHAIAVLVIACPCALGLATPAAILSATGRGAREGLLLRDADAFERLARVDTVAFDKTGTLTIGRPRLASIERIVLDRAPTGHAAELDGPSRPVNTSSATAVVGDDEILGWCAAVESKSEQPLARGIVAAARERGVRIATPKDFRAWPGIGVTGEVAGHALWIGSPRAARERARERADGRSVAAEASVERAVATLEARGETPVVVEVDGTFVAALGLVDTARENSVEAVRALRADGIEVHVLSGDRRAAVEAVTRPLGLTAVRSELTPESKVSALHELRAASRRVVMVGDGLNDAPALSAADAGIAMGGGADVAIAVADASLLRDDPLRVAVALRLARATMRTVRANLAWAFAYNWIALPFAAGVFEPLWGLALPAGLAGAAMSISSLAVVLNSLRLRSVRLLATGESAGPRL